MRAKVAGLAERVGRAVVNGLDEMGFGLVPAGKSLYWLALGHRHRQPVRLSSIVAQAMDIGIWAIPILTVLAFTIGVMLAIQGIYTLRVFGAESRVTTGIALSLVRGVFGADYRDPGRRALRFGFGGAARHHEGQSGNRRAVGDGHRSDPLSGGAPLVAMVVMVPALTVWSPCGVPCSAPAFISVRPLEISFGAYVGQVIDALRLADVGAWPVEKRDFFPC